MLKQCLTLLKHAMMLKQCLTLLKHSKTVVNTVWLKSEAIQPFFCNHMKCLQNSPKCSNNLWHPAKYSIKEMSVSLVSWSLSLSNALWAVSKSSRAFWAIPLSHVSFELRDWLTRSLLGSLRRNSVTALYPTLHRSARGHVSIWQGLGIEKNIIPDVSSKIWRFAGWKKIFYNFNEIWSDCPGHQ